MTFLPTRRLLLLVGCAALLAAAAGPLPELLPVWLLVVGGIGLTAVADLVLSLTAARLPGVEVPGVVRFSRDRRGVVPVTFTRAPAGPRRLRFILSLPSVFQSESEELTVELPDEPERTIVDWPCTPGMRGRFVGVVACLEVVSSLGCWQLRKRIPCTCDIRVYPNLLTERRQLAAVFLARGQLGSMVRRTVGRGREFEKLRDYLPGDGFDEIHWKATAKRGRPVTKVFQAERTQEIYVVIDRSRLSGRPLEIDGVAQTVLERYLTASLLLMLAAERQGDRFGLVAYDDRVRVFVRAGRGSTHFAACREAALALQPAEGTPDLAEVVTHLRTHLRRRALLFFLTDLTDPVLAEDFTRHIGLLARQHLVFVSQLRVPGVRPLFSGDEVREPAEVYARLAGHLRWTEGRALAQNLKPLGVTSAVLEDETLAAQLVTQYLRVKQRQAL